MRRSLRVLLVLVIATCALVLSSPLQAMPPTVNGSVGPGFVIGLKRSGQKVTTLKARRYRFVIRDFSGIHNFHLTGPGVNRATSVSLSGTTSIWTLTLARGTYRFRCDVHPPSLRGRFTVT